MFRRIVFVILLRPERPRHLGGLKLFFFMTSICRQVLRHRYTGGSSGYWT
jgi:hypothetical protein